MRIMKWFSFTIQISLLEVVSVSQFGRFSRSLLSVDSCATLACMMAVHRKFKDVECGENTGSEMIVGNWHQPQSEKWSATAKSWQPQRHANFPPLQQQLLGGNWKPSRLQKLLVVVMHKQHTSECNQLQRSSNHRNICCWPLIGLGLCSQVSFALASDCAVPETKISNNTSESEKLYTW